MEHKENKWFFGNVWERNGVFSNDWVPEYTFPTPQRGSSVWPIMKGMQRKHVATESFHLDWEWSLKARNPLHQQKHQEAENPSLTHFHQSQCDGPLYSDIRIIILNRSAFSTSLHSLLIISVIFNSCCREGVVLGPLGTTRKSFGVAIIMLRYGCSLKTVSSKLRTIGTFQNFQFVWFRSYLKTELNFSSNILNNCSNVCFALI